MKVRLVGVFTVLLLFGLSLNNIFAQSSDLQVAVEEKVRATHSEITADMPIVLADTNEQLGWAFGNWQAQNDEMPHGYFLAEIPDDQWIVSVEGISQFEEMLNRVPIEVVPPKFKEEWTNSHPTQTQTMMSGLATTNSQPTINRQEIVNTALSAYNSPWLGSGYCTGLIGLSWSAGGVPHATGAWTGNNQIIQLWRDRPDLIEITRDLTKARPGDAILYTYLDDPLSQGNFGFGHSGVFIGNNEIVQWNISGRFNMYTVHYGGYSPQQMKLWVAHLRDSVQSPTITSPTNNQTVTNYVSNPNIGVVATISIAVSGTGSFVLELANGLSEPFYEHPVTWGSGGTGSTGLPRSVDGWYQLRVRAQVNGVFSDYSPIVRFQLAPSPITPTPTPTPMPQPVNYGILAPDGNPRSITVDNRPGRFTVPIEANYSPYLIDGQTTAGSPNHLATLRNANGTVITTARTSIDGRFIVDVENIPPGTYYLDITSLQSGATGSMNVTAWVRSIAGVFPDWWQGFYSDVTRWWTPVECTSALCNPGYIHLQRLHGQGEMQWRLVHRTTGQQTTGVSIGGLAIMPMNVNSGRFDIFLTPIGEGSFQIRMFAGTPPLVPTSTPVPTNTPVVPTSTPVPTNTPVVPTSTPVPVSPACRVDIVQDGVVNILDIQALANVFDASVGDARYNPDYDFDDNGVINVLDIQYAAGLFGQTCP